MNLGVVGLLNGSGGTNHPFGGVFRVGSHKQVNVSSKAEGLESVAGKINVIFRDDGFYGFVAATTDKQHGGQKNE